MSITIQSDVITLQNLNNEIKASLEKLRNLRNQKNVIEKRIQEYLVAQNLPGIKYQGFVVIRNDKTTHRRKKKVKQLEDSLSVLKKYNIEEPQRVLTEILNARRGSPIPNNKLIVKKYDKN